MSAQGMTNQKIHKVLQAEGKEKGFEVDGKVIKSIGLKVIAKIVRDNNGDSKAGRPRKADKEPETISKSQIEQERMETVNAEASVEYQQKQEAAEAAIPEVMKPPKVADPTKPLALELRPRFFREVVYNEQVTTIMQSMLKKGQIPNGLLLSGTRGIGKTTLARIFARTLNCEAPVDGEACGECRNCIDSLNDQHPDIREIDGASHGKIEDIRRILDQVYLAPFLGKYKVFIIDEAHNLGRSQASWDALLKVLEEPPDHVCWIFCTTQKQKIPMTIKSRLISLELKTAPARIIADHIEGVMWTQGMVKLKDGEVFNRGIPASIARTARGSFRDALSLLEKVRAYCDEKGWEQSIVDHILGDPGLKLMNHIANKDRAQALQALIEMSEEGFDPIEIYEEGLVWGMNELMTIALGGDSEYGSEFTLLFKTIEAPRVFYMAKCLVNRPLEVGQATEVQMLLLKILIMELCA
jgi:DNA polymerase III subunit gamma/tau